ncbi:MAG TPA: hypothetical protein VLH16_04310, partial [Bacteroidales bacterium]|nr:hypothetical protein [Bacteroidales bacterium]
MLKNSDKFHLIVCSIGNYFYTFGSDFNRLCLAFKKYGTAMLTNSFWATQLKYRAMNESSSINGSHCPSCRFLGLGSAIKIYNPQHESQAIYGTTIHETAHA